jgi:hypothetical protein
MTMADLRITGVTNNQLELQAPDGTRHYLEISDDLLKAMKSRPASLPAALTPREIQAEIRLGTSVQELVAKTGADEDQVAKYAAPILTELRHIVTLARNIRLSLAGDRFTEPTQIEFGAVMDERLSSNKATNSNWFARKTVEGVWLVSVEYVLGTVKGIATWSFDPKNLFLVPENQSALLLSNASPLSLAETKSVPTEQALHPTVIATQPESLEEVKTPTASLSVVPELEEVATETEVISVVEMETRSVFHVVEDVVEESEHYEFEAIDEDHYQSESFAEVESEAEQAFQQEADTVEEVKLEPVQEAAAESASVEAPKVQSTSRWAEVLFGSKDYEEDK